MKALVKHSPKVGIWMEDVPIPECGGNEVKIKITHTGNFRIDLHIYQWDEWAQRTLELPLVIGHEFCGIIEEIGPGVTHCKVGDRVSGEGISPADSVEIVALGKDIYAIKQLGWVSKDLGIFRILVIPESNYGPFIILLFEIAAFFDHLECSPHSVSYNIVGEDVLITGAGPIGIMCASICKFVVQEM
ncbi:MAG: hypothetical protein Ct9H300mP18_06400 [Candidatus Neomarinimicrobiota bacterium]|nr:MAG: hypothetical protein Ct9H300mP18_06400 [Candidatus Neomarinimicrobiota bacterium]